MSLGMRNEPRNRRHSVKDIQIKQAVSIQTNHLLLARAQGMWGTSGHEEG
jgi:hypothetical protein